MSCQDHFDLLLPRGSLRAALSALADLADRDEIVGCTVDLSEPPELWVPFDGTHFEQGPSVRVTVADRGDAWLKGALWLPVDDAVRRYLDHCPPSMVRFRTDRGGEEASIGPVSVFLHVGVRWEIVSIGAMGSWMSYLFESSAAVRNAMVEVMNAAGGRFAILSLEGGARGAAVDLLRPDVELVLPSLDDRDPASVDAFVDAMQAAHSRR